MSFQELSADLSEARMHVQRAESYHAASQNYNNQSVLLPPELKYLQSALALCRIVEKTFEERLDIKSVSALGNDKLTGELENWWSLNNTPELASMLHSEALITGRGYMTVSTAESDSRRPILAVESAHSMVHRVDKRTGATIEALRFYDDDQRAVYYDQEHAEFLRTGPGTNGWVRDTDVPNPVMRYDLGGLLPVIPFINRGRTRERWGRPEALDIRPVQDAVARAFTDLQAASALMAIPQRLIFGVEDEEVTDENGDAVSGQELYMARLLTFAESSGKISEFQAAQLTNFTQTLMYYTRLASALSGIPVTYFAVASEANPASGDAIVADESRLVKRAERLCRGFTRPWRDVWSVAAMLSGYSQQDTEAISVEWQPPGTYTQSAQADWAVKVSSIKRDDGSSLVTPDWLLSKLGLTPAEIEQINDAQEESALKQFLRQPVEDPSQQPVKGNTDGGN